VGVNNHFLIFLFLYKFDSTAVSKFYFFFILNYSQSCSKDDGVIHRRYEKHDYRS